MTDEETFKVETPRLILRDLTDDDWPLIYALSREPEVTRYQTWMRVKGEDECRRWLTDLLAGTNHKRPRVSYNLGIMLRSFDDLIGWLGFGKPYDSSKGEIDIGYALLPHYWNRGYMTEAVHATIDYIFENLDKQSVYATCVSTNPASARVLEKSGMSFVEAWVEEDPDLGIVEEHLCFRVERQLWFRTSR